MDSVFVVEEWVPNAFEPDDVEVLYVAINRDIAFELVDKRRRYLNNLIGGLDEFTMGPNGGSDRKVKSGGYTWYISEYELVKDRG